VLCGCNDLTFHDSEVLAVLCGCAGVGGRSGNIGPGCVGGPKMYMQYVIIPEKCKLITNSKHNYKNKKMYKQLS